MKGVKEQVQVRYVEARCVGRPPATRVASASGVSEVDVDGQVLRCTVTGSLQPFLEALHGTEVVDLVCAPSPHRTIASPDLRAGADRRDPS